MVSLHPCSSVFSAPSNAGLWFIFFQLPFLLTQGTIKYWRRILSFNHSKSMGKPLYGTDRIFMSLTVGSWSNLSQHKYSIHSVTQLFLTLCDPVDFSASASLSSTNYWSLLKLMSIELVMPSNHLILFCPHLLPHSVFSSIRIFSNESVLHIRWTKYWSFSFSISPSKE